MAEDLKALMSELAELKAKVASLERATPLANASVGGGRLRFYDGGELLIEGGNLRVTGTGYVSGTLSVSGTMSVSGTLGVSGSTNLDGPVTINGNVTSTGAFSNSGTFTNAGATNLNGPTNVKGAWKLEGNGDITGNVTQTGSYQVNAPGQIKVGTGMTFVPGLFGGAVQFANGDLVSDGNGPRLRLGSGFVGFGSDGAGVSSGGRSFSVNGTTHRLGGMSTIARASANNATVGSVYADTSGNLYRVVT